MVKTITGIVTESFELYGVSGKRLYTRINLKGDEQEEQMLLQGIHLLNKNDLVRFEYEQRFTPPLGYVNTVVNFYQILDPEDRSVRRTCLAEH